MQDGVDIGPYRLDPYGNRLMGEGREIPLSPLAARFLALLAGQSGAAVTRETIIEALWRGDYLTGDPALNRVVSETRRALGDDPRAPRYIQTVPRLGYRLIALCPPAPPLPPARTVAPAPRSNRAIWLLAGTAALIVLIVVAAKLVTDDLLALRAVPTLRR